MFLLLEDTKLRSYPKWTLIFIKKLSRLNRLPWLYQRKWRCIAQLCWCAVKNLLTHHMKLYNRKYEIFRFKEFRAIWFEMLSPKIISFGGVLTPNLVRHRRYPERHITGWNNASFDVLIQKIRAAVFTVGDDKKKRKWKERKGSLHKVKRRIFAGEMYLTFDIWQCVEWAAEHFGLGLT